MPLKRRRLRQTTRFTEKIITKGGQERAATTLDRGVAKRAKRRVKRVRFLRIVRMELGHKLERWLAWVGEANHSYFVMGATNRDAPVRLLHGAF